MGLALGDNDICMVQTTKLVISTDQAILIYFSLHYAQTPNPKPQTPNPSCLCVSDCTLLYELNGGYTLTPPPFLFAMPLIGIGLISRIST